MIIGKKGLVALGAGALFGVASGAPEVKPMAEIMKDYDMFLGQHLARKLAETNSTDLGCGESIGSFTAADVETLGELYLASILSGDAGTQAAAREILLGAVNYDVNVVKLCMSCNEARAILTEGEMTDAEYGFDNYCGEGMFGADDVYHSTLGLIPMDPGTSNIVNAKMQGIVQAHGTSLFLNGNPTANFPADLGAWMATTDPNEVVVASADKIVSILFSSAGAIAVLPDYLGYGTSATHQRAFFSRRNYAQAFTLGWLAAREYVSSETGGCSELLPSTTVFGFSEGGYACVAGSFALEQIGVRILGAYPSGAPVNTPTQFAFGYQLFAEGSENAANVIQSWQGLSALLAYSYSIENPFLANTGSGQVLAAPEYYAGDDKDVRGWFDYPTVGGDFFAFTPANPTDIWNADMGASFKAAIAAGETNPCPNHITGDVDKLCEALVDSDLADDLESVNFPVFMCYSADDQIVSPDNAPNYDANANLNAYIGVLEGAFLKPQGSHGESLILCSIAPILTFGAETDNPIAMVESTCTNSPTSSPSSPPTPGGNSTDPSGDGAWNPTSMFAVMFAAVLALFV